MSASRDKSIRMWDVSTGVCLMTLVCHMLVVSLVLAILNININYEFLLGSYKLFIFIFAVLKSFFHVSPD